MAFNTDYSSFRTAVASWLDWSDSTTTSLNDLIEVGQNKVHKALRTRTMETAYSATINSSGQAALPSDYIEMKFAYINGSPVRKLTRKSAEWIYENYPVRSDTGQEQYFAREGSNFIFGPAGGDGSLMKGIYYAKSSSMSGGSTINSLFSAHPEIFLMATLSEAEPFIGRDERTAMWEAKFQQLVQIANSEAKAEDQSGSRLAASLA